jgi:hypothetical protein
MQNNILSRASLATLVPLGQCVVTRGVNHLCEERGINLAPYFIMHSQGNFGDLGDEDSAAQNASLKAGDGQRMMSVWNIKNAKIWIITEADRSVTTALLPEEY